eukprot:gene8331-14296_t
MAVGGSGGDGRRDMVFMNEMALVCGDGSANGDDGGFSSWQTWCDGGGNEAGNGRIDGDGSVVVVLAIVVNYSWELVGAIVMKLVMTSLMACTITV